jgi:hypothetical protein
VLSGHGSVTIATTCWLPLVPPHVDAWVRVIPALDFDIHSWTCTADCRSLSLSQVIQQTLPTADHHSTCPSQCTHSGSSADTRMVFT